MKISKTLLVALGMASLAACGGNTTNENAANMDANPDANTMVTDNMGMDPNMTTDANMGAMNSADGMNSTENAMANDMTTNNADTNLANGM
jgi:hypothetical protein